MNYRKINFWAFGLLNGLWAIMIPPLLIYLTFFVLPDTSLNGIFNSILITSISVIIIYAFFKLKEGNIFPALIGILFLSFIIDLDGLKSINILLINIDLLYATNGDFIFDFKLFQGPHATFNTRLTDFQFNQIGFNAVGLIQIYLLYKQKTASDLTDLEFENV